MSESQGKVSKYPGYIGPPGRDPDFGLFSYNPDHWEKFSVGDRVIVKGFGRWGRNIRGVVEEVYPDAWYSIRLNRDDLPKRALYSTVKLYPPEFWRDTK